MRLVLLILSLFWICQVQAQSFGTTPAKPNFYLGTNLLGVTGVPLFSVVLGGGAHFRPTAVWSVDFNNGLLWDNELGLEYRTAAEAFGNFLNYKMRGYFLKSTLSAAFGPNDLVYVGGGVVLGTQQESGNATIASNYFDDFVRVQEHNITYAGIIGKIGLQWRAKENIVWRLELQPTVGSVFNYDNTGLQPILTAAGSGRVLNPYPNNRNDIGRSSDLIINLPLALHVLWLL